MLPHKWKPTSAPSNRIKKYIKDPKKKCAEFVAREMLRFKKGLQCQCRQDRRNSRNSSVQSLATILWQTSE
jgi:hypothetical protein